MPYSNETHHKALTIIIVLGCFDIPMLIILIFSSTFVKQIAKLNKSKKAFENKNLKEG
jgi:hypothetical protein